MPTKKFEFCLGCVIAIVALRIAIGVHFLMEGYAKFDKRDFSSAPLLSTAVGPLAPVYHDMVPDFHNWRNLVAVPRQQKPNTHGADSEQQKAAEEACYANWLEEIVKDWKARKDDVVAGCEFDKSQKKLADRLVEVHEKKLAEHLWANRDEIAAYRNGLHVLDGLLDTRDSSDPVGQKEIAKKRAEAKEQAAAISGGVKKLESALERELLALRTDEQMAAWDPTPPPPFLKKFDVFVACSILAMGACLIAGLFTRLAAAGAVVFLLSVIMTQPPGAQFANLGFFYYQVVEVFALAALAVIGAGRWAGLDFFFRPLVARCCSTKETADASE